MSRSSRIIGFGSIREGVGKTTLIEGVADVLHSLGHSAEYISYSELVSKGVANHPNKILITELKSGAEAEQFGREFPESELVCVLDGTITGLIASYDLIRNFIGRNRNRQVGVVINNVTTAEEAKDLYLKLKKVAVQFLRSSIQMLGHVPTDHGLEVAGQYGAPITKAFPGSAAGIAIKTLATEIVKSRFSIDRISGEEMEGVENHSSSGQLYSGLTMDKGLRKDKEV